MMLLLEWIALIVTIGHGSGKRGRVARGLYVRLIGLRIGPA
jgi:hypothetical protein